MRSNSSQLSHSLWQYTDGTGSISRSQTHSGVRHIELEVEVEVKRGEKENVRSKSSLHSKSSESRPKKFRNTPFANLSIR